MSAYYNEHDKYAAQWLRNLIASGHIARASSKVPATRSSRKSRSPSSKNTSPPAVLTIETLLD